jgi:hypothetical protein
MSVLVRVLVLLCVPYRGQFGQDAGEVDDDENRRVKEGSQGRWRKGRGGQTCSCALLFSLSCPFTQNPRSLHVALISSLTLAHPSCPRPSSFARCINSVHVLSLLSSKYMKTTLPSFFLFRYNSFLFCLLESFFSDSFLVVPSLFFDYPPKNIQHHLSTDEVSLRVNRGRLNKAKLQMAQLSHRHINTYRFFSNPWLSAPIFLLFLFHSTQFISPLTITVYFLDILPKSVSRWSRKRVPVLR